MCEHFGSSTLLLDTALEPTASVHQCISHFQLQTGFCVIVNVNTPRREALPFLFSRTLVSAVVPQRNAGKLLLQATEDIARLCPLKVEPVSLWCVQRVGAENYAR